MPNEQPIKMWSGRFRESDRPITILLIGALILLTLSLQASAQIHKGQCFTLQNLGMKPQEHVTGIDLKLTAAMFEQMTPLPQGWTMQINNDPSWHVELSGDIHVGSAALSERQLNAIQFCIREDNSLGLHFAASGGIHVTDWRKPERTLPLTLKNLHFTEGSR